MVGLRELSFAAATLVLCSCAQNWQSHWDRELDTEPPTFVVEPSPKSTLQKLSEINLFFSEPVVGAQNIQNYELSGTAVGDINLDKIEVMENDRKFRLKLSGKLSDGPFHLKLKNIYDLVGNPLKSNTVEWFGDGEPKWRFLQRKMSRGFISVSQIPMVKEGDYLYIAYADESCQSLYGFSDATVIRYYIPANTYEIVGEPCIIKTVEAASNITSLIFYQGSPIVAFRDTSNSTVNGKISVKKLGPNGWEYLGNPAFSPNQGFSSELFSYQSRLYVSFRDQGNSNRLRIYYMDLSISNPTWQELPPGGLLSASNPFRNVPAVFQNNQFYFAFRESTNILKINYYDLVNSNYGTELSFSSINNIDNVQMVAHEQHLVVQYSYVNSTRRIKLRYYDNTTWATSSWPDLFPELDL